MQNHNRHSDRVQFLMSEERKLWHNPEEVLRNAGASRGMIMADLGSGPGFFTIPMAELTGENGLVYAVDNSQIMLDSLKKNIANSKINPRIIEIINSDIVHMGIPKESVDFVLFANVLHEVKNKEAFLQEIKRISRLTANVVNVDWKKIQTEHGPPQEIRLSENEAIKILSENGFTITRQMNAGPYHYEIVCQRTE